MFGRHFEIIQADTDALREEVFRLRYQVYCAETGYEDDINFPDRLEKDVFDDRSVHSLLRHRRTGINAGTVRLVRPEPGNLVTLPLHDVSGEAFFRNSRRFQPAHVAEVSRFAISKTLRRHLAEFPRATHTGPFDPMRNRHEQDHEKAVLPHIVLGLFVAMVRMSRQLDLSSWVCVMEKALVRLLSRYSLHFIPVGPAVEHHGLRQPCYADIEEFLARAKAEQPEVWRLITDGGEPWPAWELAS
jgi:N-acyl amino acid synthase of PEP-CTERM/exosortase system